MLVVALMLEFSMIWFQLMVSILGILTAGKEIVGDGIYDKRSSSAGIYSLGKVIVTRDIRLVDIIEVSCRDEVMIFYFGYDPASCFHSVKHSNNMLYFRLQSSVGRVERPNICDNS